MQTDELNYEAAHLVARVSGEEGLDHPRQKAVRWLEEHGHGAKVGGFNQEYAGLSQTGFARAAVALYRTLCRAGCAPRDAGKLAEGFLDTA